MAQFRYIVNDVDIAVEFYTNKLGFNLQEQYGQAMAILQLDDLNLWVAGPKSSAAQPMPDGSQPKPGGWSRFVLTVHDLQNLVTRLEQDGVRFKNEILHGPGGQQILCLDPSGNIVELFQPK